MCFTAKKYDGFLASDSIIKTIPRLLGPGLNKAGKFPVQVSHNESLVQKCEEQKATIKFQLKKVLFNYFIFPVLKQFLSSDLPARKFCLIYIFLACLAQVMWVFCMPHVHIENQLWKKYRKYGDENMRIYRVPAPSWKINID